MKWSKISSFTERHWAAVLVGVLLGFFLIGPFLGVIGAVESPAAYSGTGIALGVLLTLFLSIARDAYLRRHPDLVAEAERAMAMRRRHIEEHSAAYKVSGLRYMQWAATLLATGSLLLLLGPLMWILGDIYWGYWWGGFDFTLPGMMAHFLGWVILGVAVHRLHLGLPRERQMVAAAMMWAFAASTLGFVAGMFTLPLAFPERAYFIFTVWSLYLRFGLFPDVPSVYSPVVMAHAALYLIASRIHPSGRERNLLVGGALFLLLFVVTSLAVQVWLWVDVWVWTLAGISAVGYSAIALGWRSARSSPESSSSLGESDPTPRTC